MGDMMWDILPDISLGETGGDWRRLHIAIYFQLAYASVCDYAAWKLGGLGWGRAGGCKQEGEEMQNLKTVAVSWSQMIIKDKPSTFISAH